ncbi:MAG: LPXTG cell wall anchor domain-containing protein [Lachnospiraceae bacterium]|nr:LPXTG cell wall anchor domain-containing protein [Lachnospiraceae bacterium]
MKKLVSIAASLLIAAAPLSVLAKWSPTPYHHGGSYDDDESSPVIDPCAVSNPALAGKGCVFYVNGQIVTANGDGTFTTSAGNVFDGSGKLLYNIYGGGQAAGQASASQNEFRFNHDVAGFLGVWVDGNYVDFSNFDYWSGSTVIRLKQSYINTLSEGVHTLTAKWSDGAQMSTQFTVSRGNKGGVPNTGESDNTAYYVMMGGALIVMAGAGYVLATNK